MSKRTNDSGDVFCLRAATSVSRQVGARRLTRLDFVAILTFICGKRRDYRASSASINLRRWQGPFISRWNATR